MCKKRIEKAALTDGVSKAQWNVGTKVMTITYDSTKTSAEAIQQQIAVSGHDTENKKRPNRPTTCCRAAAVTNGNSLQNNALPRTL